MAHDQYKISAELIGARELEAALEQLPKATAKAVLRRALLKAGEPTEKLARDYAPVRSGRLRRSLDVKTTLKKSQQGEKYGAVQAYIGASWPTGAHAHLVEFGTAHSAPNPFMRPAWDATRHEVLETIKGELWDSILRASKRLALKAEKGTLSLKTARDIL